MKTVRIVLAQLVREEKVVAVEVPDDFDSWDADRQADLAHATFEADDGEGFTSDACWGCEEGTHVFLAEEDGQRRTCDQCGTPFTITEYGTATHDGPDHDADADHVPYSCGTCWPILSRL